MEQRYNVIITPDAAADLSQIKSYIAYTLQAPDTALKYIRGLRQEICKLDSFPAAIAPVSDEPWHSRGIRRIIYKNFYIYYSIAENTKCVYVKCVYVLNVIYAKRDQLNVLTEYN